MKRFRFIERSTTITQYIIEAENWEAFESNKGGYQIIESEELDSFDPQILEMEELEECE